MNSIWPDISLKRLATVVKLVPITRCIVHSAPWIGRPVRSSSVVNSTVAPPFTRYAFSTCVLLSTVADTIAVPYPVALNVKLYSPGGRMVKNVPVVVTFVCVKLRLLIVICTAVPLRSTSVFWS